MSVCLYDKTSQHFPPVAQVWARLFTSALETDVSPALQHYWGSKGNLCTVKVLPFLVDSEACIQQ